MCCFLLTKPLIPSCFQKYKSLVSAIYFMHVLKFHPQTPCLQAKAAVQNWESPGSCPGLWRRGAACFCRYMPGPAQPCPALLCSPGSQPHPGHSACLPQTPALSRCLLWEDVTHQCTPIPPQYDSFWICCFRPNSSKSVHCPLSKTVGGHWTVLVTITTS